VLLDNLSVGGIYGRVKSAALTTDGLVLLDQVEVGTYGLIYSADISNHHIKLSKTVKDGKWYDTGGVIIDSSSGILVYGKDRAFVTRATESGVDQCYVDSDGVICAGAGAVKLNENGLHIKGQGLIMLDSAGALKGWVYGSSEGLEIHSYEGDIVLHGSDYVNIAAASPLRVYSKITQMDYNTNILYDIFPFNDTSWLGSTQKPWYRAFISQIGNSTHKAVVYCDGLSACPLPTRLNGLAIIKKIKAPIEMLGHFGQGIYFNEEDFPDEMKIDAFELNEKRERIPTGKKEVELIRTIGVLVQAVRELTQKIEVLEAR